MYHKIDHLPTGSPLAYWQVFCPTLATPALACQFSLASKTKAKPAQSSPDYQQTDPKPLILKQLPVEVGDQTDPEFTTLP
ncbi:MAG: hypothetical protein A2600_09425 [Candidatus Lambdaproteobacteria bacterium RIFOXYD1_FULL_56_27]|uniref:Uncharacterized protein n=1 Tax=Candidatus Lambdaproteobacteria bacterium RIFOXYD2_FULL_56_26 TaxID=1817773 RepID=A0A1F6GUQ2_9PROT|nr:MAG: hypothetical protein A2557_04695 [Candidatus Lambdaproteobacteria bacterium RIFOXYD2_FULL_56_26]OGH02272.1 MAG: hypothetical protein A2426_03175 [Candidatus Lambdaproteobacteria bacterium RIFOXYC1_FULL_56_13]OGH10041.1 MAG: hypothetical protein A2600_09425 [Candidatus Lambdaproteobacteria bacterium RIFOXYD1_FULL_56_27]